MDKWNELDVKSKRGPTTTTEIITGTPKRCRSWIDGLLRQWPAIKYNVTLTLTQPEKNGVEIWHMTRNNNPRTACDRSELRSCKDARSMV